MALFYDARERAFYMTAADDPGLMQRPVSTFDSAVPSGMSVSVENLIRLGDVCGEKRWLDIAESALHAHYARALENPFGFSNLLERARPLARAPDGDRARRRRHRRRWRARSRRSTCRIG